LTIFLICDTYGHHRGGIERHVEGLSVALRSAGHETEILTTSTLLQSRKVSCLDHLVVEGVHRYAIVRLLRSSHSSAAGSLTLFTHGSFYEYCHLSSLARDGYWNGLIRNARTYLFDFALTGRLLNRFGTVAVLTQSEGSDLIQSLRVSPSRIFVSPNYGSDPHVGPQAPTPPPDMPPPPWILGIGRIEPRKNFHNVIPALIGTGVSFILAGTDEGGLSAVFRMSRRYPAVGFRFLGPISEPVKEWVLAASLATILPSHLEGVPFATLESLERGVPAIVTSASYVPPWDGIYYCSSTPQSIGIAVQEVRRRTKPVPPAPVPTADAVARDLMDRLSTSSPANPGPD